jgi:CheY-like chemotaxis protein
MANILLVDDDPILLKLYKTRLERDKHTVQISPDGEDALNVLTKFKADIIILDLMMPKINGFKFLEKYRQLEAYKNIPVIVFSSLIRPDQAEYLKKMGVLETINKIDVTPTQLVETINKTLEQHKA